MEEDYKPAVQHQRRVNPKIHDVIKNEVEKLLDAGLIYPISDSPWVSPIHCVPKKGGFTVVQNEENELIPTRLVTGWRISGKRVLLFLMDSRRYFQIPIDPRDQEKSTFTGPYGTFASTARICLSAYAMHRARSKGVCWPSFTTWLKRQWKSSWMTSRSLGIPLKIASPILRKCCKDVKTPICVLTGRRAILWSKRALSSAIKFLKIKLGLGRLDKAKIDVIAQLPHPTLSKELGVFLVMPVFTGDS
ncbi:hypothetical protein Tco_0628639 [Tanacetum coccineum]|uniref:Reverse transcriptase domain-containing protein n=1 Tax=Tanacetum coccineum TaxID=301880 RepID=A0ABQ4WQU7_9ASTR